MITVIQYTQYYNVTYVSDNNITRPEQMTHTLSYIDVVHGVHHSVSVCVPKRQPISYANAMPIPY